MVLSYSYLWNREHIKGETDGRKDRPSVVVLVINRTPGDVAYVLPTSTSNHGVFTKSMTPVPFSARQVSTSI